MSLHAPIYAIKVLKFDGTAFTYTSPDGTTVTPAMPLPVASVEFTETLFLPGQSQPGTFTLTLHNTRAPEWMYLRPLYNALAFEQRVEIYANESLKGNPVFSGIITEFSDDLGARQVSGEDARHRLVTAKLQPYETLSGNARDLLLSLLKNYQTEFKDNFDRAAFGADWSFPDGAVGWSIVDGVVERLTAPGDQRMHTAATWAATLWQECQVAFDFSFNDITATGTGGDMLLYLYFDSEANEFSISSPAFADSVPSPDCVITSNGDNGYSRSYPLDTVGWNHCDIYLSPSATAGKVDGRLFINGIEMVADTFSASAVASTWVIRIDNASATVPCQFDNFEFNPRLNALTAGTIDLSTETVTHDANGEAQLSALEFICEQIGWEYRVNYGAGQGNDTLDAGASVGRDWSDDIVLEDGVNIERLQMQRAVSDLATRLRVYGQAQDEARSRAVVSDLDAMDTYGIVIGDCQDPAIIDASTARIVGLSRLAQTSAGAVSISGRIRDEWEIYAQNAIWGISVWGDFIWGGRSRWRPGDYI